VTPIGTPEPLVYNILYTYPPANSCKFVYSSLYQGVNRLNISDTTKVMHVQRVFKLGYRFTCVPQILPLPLPLPVSFLFDTHNYMQRSHCSFGTTPNQPLDNVSSYMTIPSNVVMVHHSGDVSLPTACYPESSFLSPRLTAAATEYSDRTSRNKDTNLSTSYRHVSHTHRLTTTYPHIPTHPYILTPKHPHTLSYTNSLYT
jgi:hypothetical protein